MYAVRRNILRIYVYTNKRTNPMAKPWAELCRASSPDLKSKYNRQPLNYFSSLVQGGVPEARGGGGLNYISNIKNRLPRRASSQ